MKKILLLSDTHSYLDERILSYCQQADEIWHAGDFGNTSVLDKLKEIKPLRGVYGNIDSQEIRNEMPLIAHFQCEDVSVLMIHIGGYPKKYSPLAAEQIEKHKPKLFISGHSHILKVMYDKENQLMHFNPGACGKQGWHQMRTMLRFEIDKSEIKNLELIELGEK